MSSPAIESEVRENESNVDVQPDAFHALEQRVLRAIELLRAERELRSAAEQRARAAEVHALQLEALVEEQAKRLESQVALLETQSSGIAEHAARADRVESELGQLHTEREQVRQRVERLLLHLDEFAGA